MLIEKELLTYLKTKLSVPVYVTVPENNTEEKYVELTVVDEGNQNHIEAYTVEFLSYGKNKFDAASLDQEVRAALESITESTDCYGSHCGGGGDNTDLTVKRYCYRCYYNLYY